MWVDGPRGLTLDHMCTVAPVQSSGFANRDVIPVSKAADVKSISDVLNASDYQSFHTIGATVSFGDDEMEAIKTYSGWSKCKKDWFLEDVEGIFRFDIWESQFPQLKNKQK